MPEGCVIFGIPDGRLAWESWMGTVHSIRKKLSERGVHLSFWVGCSALTVDDNDRFISPASLRLARLLSPVTYLKYEEMRLG